MTTEERMELGATLKREMNCSALASLGVFASLWVANPRKGRLRQAVVRAFADSLELDEATLTRLGSGFGSGMGTMEGTCGALVGAIMVASLKSQPDKAMALSRKIMPRFKELCGATICRDLKGVGTGKMLCSCEDCVRNAIKATDETLREVL